MTNLITVTEFHNYAPEVDLGAYTDTTVSGFLAMATQQVVDFLGYDPHQTREVEKKVDGYVSTQGELIFSPPKIPIVSIETLSITKANVEVNLNINTGSNTGYDISPNNRRVIVPSTWLTMVGFPLFTSFYALKGINFYLKSTYVAGYLDSEMPETIKYATSLYVRDIISRRSNTVGAKEISQGGISIKFSERDGKSDLVRDAESVLQTYKIV